MKVKQSSIKSAIWFLPANNQQIEQHDALGASINKPRYP